jgi:hypothetical protein
LNYWTLREAVQFSLTTGSPVLINNIALLLKLFLDIREKKNKVRQRMKGFLPREKELKGGF